MPAPYIDLFNQLLATAAQNKSLSPHEVARQFVLSEGVKRGGVEVIVALDKNHNFLAAGTQNQPASVDFPASIKPALHDPNAGIVLHHNHPPDEEQFFSDTDMQGLTQHRGISWMFMHREADYSAMRVEDKMFKPAADGQTPADSVSGAFRNAKMIAQYDLFRGNDAVEENVGPELALQALHKAGVIRHYSSATTGISPEREQHVISQIYSQAADATGRFEILKHWTLPKADVVVPSTLGTKYDALLNIMAKETGNAIDRPPLATSSAADTTGLASGRGTGRPAAAKFEGPKQAPV